MEAKLKNIIFDFGGVLYDIDFQRSYKEFCRIGFDYTQVTDRMKKYILLLETGKITADEFLSHLKALAPEKVTTDEILHATNLILVGLPPHRLNYLVELKKNYRLFLLSNTNIIHYNFYNTEICANPETTKFNSMFEKRYYSFDLGYIKPHPEIFRAVLDDSNLNPAETLFVDDDPGNIKGAEALGIQTFHMPDTSLWPELMNLLK